MTKSELIENIAKKQPQLSMEQVSEVVRLMLIQMTVALVRGERIEVRGFGAFSLHHRSAKVGRNPKTGETVKIPAKVKVHFKPGLALREKVNLSTKTEDK